MIHTENLIIGAGPGGLQLAHDFKQLGRNYLVLEKAAQEGDFFTAYPRHRQLISINKVYSDAKSRYEALHFDWNSLLCDNDDLLSKNDNTNFFPPADGFRKQTETEKFSFDLLGHCADCYEESLTSAVLRRLALYS